MKNIKVAICYDTAIDYGFEYQDERFTDFTDLITVSEIKKALEFFGYKTRLVGNCQHLNQLIKTNSLECDIVFNIAEGFKSRNREGLIPSLLEINNIMHTASDAYAMSLSLNKYHTKLIAKDLGITTPEDCLIEYGTNINQYSKLKRLQYPVVIKPNCEGGSMGVVFVEDYEQLEKEVNKLFALYKEDILCEEYIRGAEVTIPLIGNKKDLRALGIVTILSKEKGAIDIYDNFRKLEPDYEGDTFCTCAIRYPHTTEEQLINNSISLFKHLKMFDYARMDFRVTEDGTPYFLEINPMPALCRNDSFEIAGAQFGLTYADIIHKILTAALNRYKF